MRDCHSLKIYLRVLVDFFVARLTANTFVFYLGKLLKGAKKMFLTWVWGGIPPPNQSLSKSQYMVGKKGQF